MSLPSWYRGETSEGEDACAAERCRTRTPPAQPFCTAHFKLLPYRIQKVLYSGPGTLEYQAAIVEAREEIARQAEERENGKVER